MILCNKVVWDHIIQGHTELHQDFPVSNNIHDITSKHKQYMIMDFWNTQQ